ncbi:putative membrane protein [Ferrimonas sediminum]|uniref:Putative membrane protein n=1 Tax=Ferrimonas sediminum TaxID=718193 RepID=A0A1G8TXM6_9GAMM|nr:SHOCT domain-containing protein [Ferrimonas sediminum]SDJ46144.1 putative membrane protein [Ferrimonas sediminum]
MAHEHFWFGGMWFFPFFCLLLFVGVAYLVISHLGRNRSGGTAPDSAVAQSALDILKVRYAKGELTLDEFEQMKRDIQR